MFERRRAVWVRVAGAAALWLTVIAVAEMPPPAGDAARPKPAPNIKPADNSYCFACHVGLKHEKLAARHQHAGVGCTACHGPSKKHSSDEDNVTPPDVMFTKSGVAPACLKCHKPAALQQDAAHEPVLAGKAAPPFGTCTDCHGKHRLAVRTRRWDKATRKLIKDDGVRMMGPAR